MGRPSKDQAGPSAKERLAAAFWESLEEAPYEQITVAALSKRANVNHNTFYYHFTNLDDMAQKLFEQDLIDDSRLFLRILFSGKNQILYWLNNVDPQSESFAAIESRIKKVNLFLNSGSAYLVELFKKELFETWKSNLNLDYEDLTQIEWMEVNFIFDGLIGLYRSLDLDMPIRHVIISQLSQFVDTEIGVAFQKTIEKIFREHATEEQVRQYLEMDDTLAI
ncbi:MAG: TetR/AcrR family transcriptional regulator [Eggerthellaceae bacterium]|nr:TetR/AcrR family transcriptional regulator [Eggerthellaceae bacterium]